MPTTIRADSLTVEPPVAAIIVFPHNLTGNAKIPAHWCNRTGSRRVSKGWGVTERTRMRDPGSFDSFYNASVRRLIGQLHAMTGSRAEAEDCVQEAYARAWQRWEKVSGYGDPEAWVRTVAYRVSISAWRKTANMRAAHRRHGAPEDPHGMSPDYV